MDERLKFIARLLDGETLSSVCREFNISRKTGYKLLQRYRDSGLHGLTDRSRRPYRQANQLPLQIETLIVRLRRERPNWGAPKIRERLRPIMVRRTRGQVSQTKKGSAYRRKVSRHFPVIRSCMKSWINYRAFFLVSFFVDFHFLHRKKETGK